MKVKFWVFFIITTLCYFSVFSQEKENIRLKVRVVNGIDGSEIKNPKIKISYALSENIISLKTEKKVSFYEVVKGANIKVAAESFQFYPEEKLFETDRLFDDDVLEIKLNPRPAGHAIITVVDNLSKEPILAKVTIGIDGAKNSQSTSAEKNELEIYYEKNGLYTILVEAEGYDSKELKEDLKVNDKSGKKINVALTKSLFSQLLSFKNRLSGESITPSSVKIISERFSHLSPKWNPSTQNFESPKGENYTIVASKEGFVDIEARIKADGNNLELLFEPKPLSSFFITINDLTTSKKVSSEIEIVSPTGVKLTASSDKSFLPKEKGEYIFTLKHLEYGEIVQKAVSQYSNDKKDIPVNFEVWSKIEIKIVVLDSLTNKPINNALIKAFNEKSKEVQGISTLNTKAFKKAVNERLFYEVSAEGYSDRTGNVSGTNVTNATVNVYLNKKTDFQEHEYAFIDALTKQSIRKTQVIILDENKKAIETLFNSAKGTYLSYKIDASKAYSISVKADGYKELNAPLRNNARNITLEMEPSNLDEVVISIYDDYTKEMLLVSDLKITSSGGITVDFKERNREYVTALSPKGDYTINFQVNTYEAINKTVKPEDFTNKRIDFFIRKKTYPIALIIQNELTDQQKDNAKAIINYLEGISLSNRFDKPTKSFLLETDPNETLQVEINVPGFRQYKASNNRKQLAMFEIKVLLEPIEPVAVVEETKKEETEIIVQTEEPKKEVQTEVPAPRNTEPKNPLETPEPEPKTAEVTVKKDEPMEAKKGRRYPLDGVNFEQSKTTMLSGSELKLNELLKFMVENPGVKIEVIGHTDKIGDERQNQRLSQFRARTVANWLFNKGIESSRITTTGKGSSEPLAANDSEETKAQNRRIEVLVIED